MRVEVLWSRGCPNYEAALRLVNDVIAWQGIHAAVELVEIADEQNGRRHQFPGSPTIRVNEHDIDPTFEGCADDCTPRCRIYDTGQGLRGLPERQWLENAVALYKGRPD